MVSISSSSRWLWRMIGDVNIWSILVIRVSIPNEYLDLLLA